MTRTAVDTGSPLKVGFTGSRDGMTDAQSDRFIEWCEQTEIDEFHHGSCVGCDAEAHLALLSLHGAEWVDRVVHQHPPSNTRLMAALAGGVTHPRRPYLVRNGDIVQACDLLVAVPRKGSRGTWHTVRMAQARRITTYIIHEDGRIEA